MRKNSLLLLLRLALPYVVILALPFIALFQIYTTSIDQAFTLEQERNLLTLEQTRDKVDNQLRNLSELSKYLAYNSEITSLISLDKPLAKTKEFYSMYELSRSLPNYKLITPGIEDVYIFFGNLDYMMQVPNAYRLSDFSKSSPIFTSTYMTDFLSTYHDNALLILGDELSPELFFVTSLPYNSLTNITNQLAIALNEDFIFGDLASIEYGTSGGILVMDSSNQVLSSCLGDEFELTSADFTFDEELNSEHIITSIPSDYSGWTYISIVPKSVITSKVSYIRDTISNLIVITLIGTILVVAFISLRRGLFFFNIFNHLAPSSTTLLPADPYKSIEHVIHSLNSRNEVLSTVIEEQNHLLKEPIIKDILYGTYSSPNQLAKRLHTTDFNLSASAYFTVLIQFSSHYQSPIQTTSLIYDLIKEAAKECVTTTHYTCNIDTDHIALLALQPELVSNFDGVITELMALNHMLTTTYHLETTIVLSPCCHYLLDVKKVFHQTIYHCQYATYRGLTGVLSPGEFTVDHSKVFYYPLSTEINLSHALHQRDQSELRTILDDIFHTNLDQYHLSLKMLEQLVFAIRRTLLQSLYTLLGITDSQVHSLATQMLHRLNALHSLPALYDCAFEIQQLISYYNKAKQSTEDHELMIRIKELIATHFTDSCFNLGALGELCNMNEHTLYNEFKTLFGVTFSDYLENYRIQAACELLKEKKVPIKDIADLIGYNSDYSFRRAFKRILGVPPSKYGSSMG